VFVSATLLHYVTGTLTFTALTPSEAALRGPSADLASREVLAADIANATPRLPARCSRQDLELRVRALRTLGVPTEWDFDNAEHLQLALHACSIAINNTVIATFGNAGVVDLLNNLLCHLRRLSIANFVVFTNGPAYTSVRKHAVAHGTATSVIDLKPLLGRIVEGIDLDGYHNFGTDEFRVISSLKFRVVEMLLQLGLNVMFQDADIVPLRDYRSLLYSYGCGVNVPGMVGVPAEEREALIHRVCLQQPSVTLRDLLDTSDVASFIMQKEAPWEWTQSNTGFMFVRSTPFALFAMGHMISMLERKMGISDQNVFGAFVDHLKELMPARIQQLPFEHFPSGYEWKDAWGQHRNASIVHANWITGIEGKIAKLNDSGTLMWNSQRQICELPPAFRGLDAIV
jgi:hypothetical protein